MKLFSFILLGFGLTSSAEEALTTFRTPAKLFNGAFSVKVVLMKDDFEFDVPMWVKPDQKKSSLDLDQLKELGWNTQNLKVDETSIGGFVVPQAQFINAKSEWAYVPDFSKRCCYGIIGQDILEKYNLRFDPVAPANIEWTLVSKAASAGTPIASRRLADLFSLRSSKNMQRAFLLNFQKGELKEEELPKFPSGLTTLRKEPIFRFSFSMPERYLLVSSLSKDLLKRAKAVGLKSGLQVTHLNQVLASKLEKAEVEDYLSGKITKVLEIKWEKSITKFDFEKNEFIEVVPVPSPARSN